MDRLPSLVAGGALALGFLAIAGLIDLRQATLFLTGGLLGAALYHGSFGFTGGWRRFAVERRGRSIRAQLLMIGAAATAMIPLTAAGSIGAQPLAGALAPVGVSVLVGAAIFGLGMQLGGGCGSGTLFTVGGGSSRMLVTLIFFIVGAVIGTAHLPWWLGLPSLPAISLGRELGAAAAVVATLAGLGLIGVVTLLISGAPMAASKASQRRGGRAGARSPRSLAARRHGAPARPPQRGDAAPRRASLVGDLRFRPVGRQDRGGRRHTGRHLGILELARSERCAFVQRARRRHLGDELRHHPGRRAGGEPRGNSPEGRGAFASMLAAAIGGVLMGYGARLSFGCNIGALFSGIASGSLHGWLWFAAAFAGSLAGNGAPVLRPRRVLPEMSARNTMLFGAALTAAPRPSPSTIIRTRCRRR